jgi:hypothetical protein
MSHYPLQRFLDLIYRVCGPLPTAEDVALVQVLERGFLDVRLA